MLIQFAFYTINFDFEKWRTLVFCTAVHTSILELCTVCVLLNLIFSSENFKAKMPSGLFTILHCNLILEFKPKHDQDTHYCNSVTLVWFG